MNQAIQNAFDAITCEEALKKRTYRYVAEKMNRSRRLIPWSGVKGLVCLACLVLAVGSGFGGYGLYYTEAATISIDVNPSIELGINRWGKVVGEAAYGEDSEAALSAVSLRHLEYEEALERLLRSDAMQEYLKGDALVSVTLEDRAASGRLLPGIKNCVDRTLEQCGGARAEYASVDGHGHMCREAHRHGMSLGKYYAIQELLAVDPQATVDDFKDKSMKEIRGHMEHCRHERGGARHGGGCSGQRNNPGFIN